jgi:hypothetical protein
MKQEHDEKMEDLSRREEDAKKQVYFIDFNSSFCFNSFFK